MGMGKALLYWTLTSVTLLFGAGWVCPGAGCGVTGLDEAGLRLANTWRGPLQDGLMQGLTWLGSVWLLAPAVLLFLALTWRGGSRRPEVFLVLSLAGASMWAHVFKVAVARPRPDLFPMLVDLPVDWSYPSAHTMQAVAVTLAALLLVRPRSAWLPGGALIAVLLVAWSRIHLQVHFPTDVLFGGVAAVFWVLGLHALWRDQILPDQHDPRHAGGI